MLRPPGRPSVPHCKRCSQFMDALTPDPVAPELNGLLAEMWYEHQDTRDDLRCWNAYCSVFDPTHIVDLEQMEAEDNARIEAEERRQLEKLKAKYEA